MPDKYKTGDIIGYILWLIAVIGLVLFIFLSLSPALSGPDIWLHLKTGEYIVQNKAIPRADIFSFNLAGKEWIDHSWLVQVIFYLVFNSGGEFSLTLLSFIVIGLAFLFLFLSIYQGRLNLNLALALLSVTILASGIRFNIRPENFSILFFSVYLLLLTKFIRTRRIFLLIPLQLLWVNCHGFHILGPLILAVFMATHIQKLDRKSYKNLTIVFLSACLVSFINPYGYKGALYPFHILSGLVNESRVFYRYIQELLTPWQPYRQIGIDIRAYYLLIALSLFALMGNFKKINPAYFVLWLIFLGMSLAASRNIIFFNFIACIVITGGLTKGGLPKIPHLLKYAVIIIIIIWGFKNNYLLLRADRRAYPSEAAGFIIKNDLPQNIFNLFNCGSYLIYRLYPDKKVFIDGRSELYAKETFRDYLEITRADNAADELLKKYNVNTVFLNSSDPNGNRLWHKLFYDKANWTLAYFSHEAVIFLRNTPQNKRLIDKINRSHE